MAAWEDYDGARGLVTEAMIRNWARSTIPATIKQSAVEWQAWTACASSRLYCPTAIVDAA